MALTYFNIAVINYRGKVFLLIYQILRVYAEKQGLSDRENVHVVHNLDDVLSLSLHRLPTTRLVLATAL